MPTALRPLSRGSYTHQSLTEVALTVTRETPLDVAARFGRIDVVNTLLDHHTPQVIMDA